MLRILKDKAKINFFSRKKGADMKKKEAIKPNMPNNRVVVDHLGNEYRTIKDLCQRYGIRPDTYCQRRKRGWSLEETLTGRAKQPVKDHNGKTYDCMQTMLKEYGLDRKTYKARLSLGWSLEEILIGYRKTGMVTDHKGNSFPTKKSMCEHYGIKPGTFAARIRAGMDLESALSKERCQVVRMPVKDHNGNVYSSVQEMCAAYNIKVRTFRSRLKQGISLEEALKDGDARTVTDHLGNVYNSARAMCAAYGVSVSAMKYRLRKGYSLEEALTTSTEEMNAHPCADHLGNVYSSKKAMCAAYGISLEAFSYRLKAGKSLEEALTKPKGDKTYREVTDHLGNVYKDKKTMCAAYGISTDVFNYRIRAGYTLDEALRKERRTRKGTISTDHLGNIYPSLTKMCAAYGVSAVTYRIRIRRGLSKEEALRKVERKRDKRNTKEKGGL